MNELILKYCKGDYTLEELEEVRDLFRRKDLDSETASILRLQWSECDNSEIGEKKRFEAVLDEVHRKIDQNRRQRMPLRRTLVRVAMTAAAILLPVIGILFFFWKQQVVVNPAKNLAVVTVANGTTREVNLPDGTKVYLNAGSRISYDSQFDQKERAVQLEGQAYFEVTKNPERPFVVTSNGVSVKVLGTKFDFESYRDNPNISVTLLEGRVSINRSEDTSKVLCMLKPNQQAVFDKRQNNLTVHEVDAVDAKAWTDGCLIFDNEELEQIALTLERTYNVKFQFQNERIKHLKFYGKFEKEKSLDEILDVIVSSQGFSYSKGQNLVIFK